MRNILIFSILLVVALGLLAFAQPQWVAKPLKDGTGPLAIKIDSRLVAPEYHSPLEWWKTHHMDIVNNGDFSETHCRQCHDVSTSCNNCHGYVGVKAIATGP
jgi:hypothetical protein